MKRIALIAACIIAACIMMSGCGAEASSQPQTAAMTTAQDSSAAPSTPAETAEQTTKAADTKPEISGGEETANNNDTEIYGGMREDEAIAEALGGSGETVVSVEKGTDGSGNEEWVIGVKKDGSVEVEYRHVGKPAGDAVETPIIFD
ncbi:hypothetical protein [Lachnoclostridium sp. MSJ-17]|uniref:hypothetical protein n=1 Tax=Lachnoclostridium sp. MSJ-17 TaxID=2841516 RepID=UPI001C118AF1|nr:hypothetical protein [Lachnoclostridium sp. MSJ-17]MBU5462537.1 hypothetical protein [Lachnoclostridium sp. MSJ-17]